MKEGYIKFNCQWEQAEFPFQEEQFTQLETARARLYHLGLIGMYSDGIGFGNISIRNSESAAFIITGSTTGQFAKLESKHYALVTEFDFAKNTISCTGQNKASAESFTHAVIYKVLPEVDAVVHVHCLWLWKKLLNVYPTTSAEIEYGTPEMADAVGKLASEINSESEKLIVMGGHQEGILAFGSSLDEATSLIINIYNQYKHD